ncbi:hypothetical protein H106_08482 [Trichophyton rubrum CBS 735.88]|nr:hypothetical protein H106_08482 [Trichophyton rubrum CBS 735.88]
MTMILRGWRSPYVITNLWSEERNERIIFNLPVSVRCGSVVRNRLNSTILSMGFSATRTCLLASRHLLGMPPPRRAYGSSEGGGVSDLMPENMISNCSLIDSFWELSSVFQTLSSGSPLMRVMNTKLRRPSWRTPCICGARSRGTRVWM